MWNRKKDTQNTKGRRKGLIREWSESIIIAAVLAIFVRTLFFEPYKIPTSSMVPTLIPGDKIFVTKVVYGPRIPFLGWRIPGIRKPARGEVVVFISPAERQKCYIKRVIGLPGDKVEIKLGNIYVNGQAVSDPAISKNFYYNVGDFAKENQSITVPEGHYFMLGDNSASSRDSRYWGFVSFDDVIGKSVFIWWPPKRVRMIQ